MFWLLFAGGEIIYYQNETNIKLMQLRMRRKNQKYPRNALRKHSAFPGRTADAHCFLYFVI